jgi:hypothetical protein
VAAAVAGFAVPVKLAVGAAVAEGALAAGALEGVGEEMSAEAVLSSL